MTNKSITKKCNNCNKELKDTSKKYCDMTCYREYQKSGNYKQPKSKTGEYVNCSNCNKNFYVPKNKLESQDVFYCCKNCYLESHKMDTVYVKCKTCGKSKKLKSSSEISKKNKGQVNFYCNDNCRSHRNKILKCEICGVEFCSVQFRKTKNGYSILRPFRKTCSQKCVKKNYRENKERKEKISIAFSGDKHPNYINGSSHNKRIRKTDLKENFSVRDKKEVFKKFKYKCFKCGSNQDLTIDHHLPFSRGGILTFSNCVLLCRSCNSKKNAKLPTDFYTDKELVKLERLGISSYSLFSINPNIS